ncbi:stAR-related lipid transfer protein 6 isoform X4 [Papio anubis]|uniref:stAR-related lipid transfer protein 6 isoform X4 n=1 Tax=Papio anubis TaxID=9555 RepID=UPI000B7AF91D|nr:stAR-related lipid transfer protein 6 isoform X4 [Papio anubis]
MGQPSKRHRPSRPNSPLRPQNKNKTKQKKPHTSTALRRKLRPVTQRETPQSIPNPDTAPPQGSPHSQLTQPSQQSSTPALAFKPPQHGAGLRCARAAVGRRALGQARKRPERRRGCCGALGRDPCWELIICGFLFPFEKKITVSSKASRKFHGNLTHSYVIPLHKVLPWAPFPLETLST